MGIELFEYKPEWETEFNRIRAYLEKNITDYMDIIHVGSTALKDALSRDEIDVDVVIESINNLPLLVKQLENINYTFLGSSNIKGVYDFKENNDFYKHNLRVVISGSDGYVKHIELLNLLKNNEGYFKKYMKLKVNLASKARNLEAYAMGKDEIVLGLLKKYDNKIKIVMPNLEKSLVNVTSSIMNKYGMHSKYKPLVSLKDIKDYRHIILLVIDGLGESIVKMHLNEKSFLSKHYVDKLTSSFPPTTVAATTSILTGIAPGENGWIGWSQYFKDIDKNLFMFSGRDMEENDHQDLIKEQVGYTPFYENFLGYNSEVYPSFKEGGAKTFHMLLKRALKETKKDFYTFTYAYWDEPDNTMHDFGPSSKEARMVVRDIDKKLEQMLSDLPKDTCVIITADHGQIDVLPLIFEKFSDVNYLLDKPISIESRCANFFIKEGFKQEFKRLFNKYFKNYYKLCDKESFARDYLINYRETNLDFIGDYVAIATDRYFISNDDKPFKGHHAGLTSMEMEVPLFFIRGK